MVFYFIVVDEVDREVVIVKSFGVDLKEFFTLLQFFHLLGLGETDTSLVGVRGLVCYLSADFAHEMLPELVSSDLVVADCFDNG